MRWQKSKAKALALCRLTQGTMGLEGQAVDHNFFNFMVKLTTFGLFFGIYRTKIYSWFTMRLVKLYIKKHDTRI